MQGRRDFIRDREPGTASDGELIQVDADADQSWLMRAATDSQDDLLTAMRGFNIVKVESKVIAAADVAEFVVDE